MSICTESTRGPREPVLQVLVAARVFLGHRVNLQEKYDYPNMAMLVTLGRMGMRERTTVHGLCRASFSTWANETGAARPDVIEACLAHREGDRIRASYNRARFDAERRELLRTWADYVSRPALALVAA